MQQARRKLRMGIALIDGVSRRCALKTLVTTPWLSAPAIVLGADDAPYRANDPMAGNPDYFWTLPRWVWLHRPASGETIKLVYWQDGQLIDNAYQQISWFLRDVRFQKMLDAKSPVIYRALDAGRIGREHLSPWALMDPILIDILYAYSAWLNYYGIQKPLTLTSALRHMLTNEMTEGAARNSWHTKAGAADVVIPGVSPAASAKFGKWLSGGGVGLYIQKNFVHLDRGRVRSWTS